MVKSCGIVACRTNVSCSTNVKFYPFPLPNQQEIRKKWMDALKMTAEPPLLFKLCSLHFEQSDFNTDLSLKETAVPNLNLPHTCQSTQSGIFQIKVPMSFYDYQKQFAMKFNLQQLPQYKNGKSNAKRKITDTPFSKSIAKKISLPLTDAQMDNKTINQTNLPVISSISSISQMPNTEQNNNADNVPIIDLDDYPDYDELMGASDYNNLLDIGKTEILDDDDEDDHLQNTQATQTLCYEQGVFSRYLTYSRDEIEFYTGLKPNRFELVINLMKRENIKFTCEEFVGLHDQLLLTLFRYRHNCDFQLMQYIFKVKYEHFLTIFCECSHILYLALNKINYLNTSKRNNGKKLIVDSATFVVQRTDNEEHMRLLIDHHNKEPTFKVLAASDENSLLVFISDTYGGGIPDRDLFTKSDFSKKVTKGEKIFQCKDFKVDDILAEQGYVKANVIKYDNVQNDLNDTADNIKRKNAVSDLIKTVLENKIISDPMPVVFWPIANKIIKNCFFLSNLQNKALNTIVLYK